MLRDVHTPGFCIPSCLKLHRTIVRDWMIQDKLPLFSASPLALSHILQVRGGRWQEMCMPYFQDCFLLEVTYYSRKGVMHVTCMPLP